MFKHFKNFFQVDIAEQLVNTLEHKWDVSQFKRAPPGKFWKDVKNQRQFMDSVAVGLGIKKWEDWYAIKQEDVLQFRGIKTLLHIHKQSLIKALTSIYKGKGSS